MSWRDPNDFEKALLADTRERWPEIIPLARCLTLAHRIEPLLLRNARRRFMPRAQAEAESLLWFSPLVAARSTREIVLHQGVAKALAGELPQEAPGGLETVWQFTRRHTRHWSAEDRMERDLRYYALLDDRERLQRGLREILRRIHAESNENRRIALSRLAKRTLPIVAPQGRGFDETRLLAQYAALALGDAGPWANPGDPQALPDWLRSKLPRPLDGTELAVEIRHDAELGQLLHLVAADAGSARIRFPGPLPARLHVAGEGQTGTWHTVTRGSRIPVAPPSPSLRLVTLDGRQWDLRTEELPGIHGKGAGRPLPLRLSYVEADREQAKAIAEWLGGQGIQVELVPESGSTVSADGQPQGAGLLHLWTRAASRYWADRSMEQVGPIANGLLLRTEEVDLPAAGVGPGQVLEWRDWSRLEVSPRAGRLLENLKRWLEGGEIEPEPESGVPQPDILYSKEIDGLLAEIEDPAAKPSRRLEIGDRLAELGDPRPGVGVIEIEVAVEDAADSKKVPKTPPSPQPEFPPEVQRLLDEIDDPKTEPPRRLEIGDELERLGDPRKGVGLDENGLPDIDWVEVPGGSFIYQNGDRRELPAFWISRYPVTNRQFQAFVDGGGYKQGGGRLKQASNRLSGQEQGLWHDLKRPKPTQPSWPQGNRPRTHIDWYEAVAFTRWLSLRLGRKEGIVRLPTEYEWEKAARGPEGLIYPWGGKYRSGFANIDETGRKDGPWYLEQTTAVGLYPHGRSPYQVEDLSGTVWEWCLNNYNDPEITAADDSGALRALRGGSWLNLSDYARADSRNGYHPFNRYNLRGFRVFSSVPIAVR